MLSEIAKEVIRIEKEAIEALEKRIDSSFEEACKIFFECKGKVVVTGIGKSGIIGQKIAATLASTGTPAFFMHPSEGLHGDLGALTKKDVVLAISSSGSSDEIVRLTPIIKRMGIKLVVMTGNKKSPLARAGDVMLDIGVKKEACPLNLAPTASTTVTLVMGDAIAVALMKMRGFNEEDFGMRHPGGALGKKLILKVGDLMHTGTALPVVADNVPVRDAIFEITSKKFGVTGVTDEKGILVGIITDGDLRRSLERFSDVLYRRADEVMTVNPKWITKDELAAKALNVMETYSITALFVYENSKKDKLVGIVHLHDLLKAGVV
jgi:arabinose-5-phosphate isomerase